jgi:hypothetical protein
MILRFKIQRALLITGPKPEFWKGQTTFTYKRLQCSMGILFDRPLPDESQERYSSFAFNLEFTIREDPPGKILQSLIDARAYKRLLTIMCSIVNRCLRAIRNAGRVYTLHEIPGVEDEEAPLLLDLWHAEMSLDGLNWTPILPESSYPRGPSISVFRSMEFEIERKELDLHRWAEIQRVIQDDLPLLPEQEFAINASEYLHRRNFRLALVESIIGLEIVLSRYLTAYLHIHKKIPQTRIEEFLSPNLTLSTRLSGLLDLTLPPDALQQINLSNVRKAVTWRNKVVHGTGRLPDGVPHAELREAISAVLDLTQRLGVLTQQMIAPQTADTDAL